MADDGKTPKKSQADTERDEWAKVLTFLTQGWCLVKRIEFSGRYLVKDNNGRVWLLDKAEFLNLPEAAGG